MTTKEKILYEALALFSNCGYGSVSVREIAGAVGIRESALYKHYKNKQDIFDTVVQVAAERIQKLQKKFIGIICR
ncbi:TetR/AcrR family transcriptional regulator [Paenibacillus sp. FSL F4-0125]|uniref:TetR/AcrR family transcriptional regulator n=1 Tax=Paenibacillus sp. FSL F4-0125 TaxID=2954730 RepID=UPI0030F838A9